MENGQLIKILDINENYPTEIDKNDEIYGDSDGFEFFVKERLVISDELKEKSSNTSDGGEKSLQISDAANATSFGAEKKKAPYKERLKEILSKRVGRQPCLKPAVEIDLVDDQEKSNAPDEWFRRKFECRLQPTDNILNMKEIKKKLENRCITPGHARQLIQQLLEQQMSTKRRADQEKRKKLYDEDNFVGLNVNNDDGDFLPNQDKKDNINEEKRSNESLEFDSQWQNENDYEAVDEISGTKVGEEDGLMDETDNRLMEDDENGEVQEKNVDSDPTENETDAEDKQFIKPRIKKRNKFLFSDDEEMDECECHDIHIENEESIAGNSIMGSKQLYYRSNQERVVNQESKDLSKRKDINDDKPSNRKKDEQDSDADSVGSTESLKQLKRIFSNSDKSEDYSPMIIDLPPFSQVFPNDNFPLLTALFCGGDRHKITKTLQNDFNEPLCSGTFDTQNLVPSSLVNRKLYNGDVLGNAVSVKNPDSDIYSADTSDDEFEKDDDNKIDSLVVKQFNTNNPDRLFNSNDEKFNTDESRSSSRHSAKNENIRYRESNNINNEDSRSDDDLIRKNVRIHSNESVEYVADEEEDARNNDEDEDDELNSSDDELKVFRRLQDANLFQNIKGERKRKFRSEFIDEEASLSGEDIDSDNEDENADLDEYEKEEGDEDDVPDEETLKLQLSKQWLKEQQDAEDRKLLYWKEKLFVDGDLHMDTDRTFRLKLRNEANMNDQASCENETGPEDVDDEENEENYDAMKRHIEMLKWKLKTDFDPNSLDIDEVNGKNSILLSTGAAALNKENSVKTNASSQTMTSSKKHSLQNRQSLSVILNQMQSMTNIPTKGLFLDDRNIAKRPLGTPAAKEHRKRKRYGSINLLKKLL